MNIDLNSIYKEDLNWAIVGDVLNPSKYAFKILENFLKKGYNAFGVSPYSKGLAPLSLDELDSNISAVNLCINPKLGLKILKEDHRHNIKYVLCQPGARSFEISKFCNENNILYIETCTLQTLT